MAIAQQLAGYSLGRADLLRRAMGKKKKEILEASWEEFSAGMVANGFSAGGDQGCVGRARPLLRLWLQQVAHRRLRRRLLLDCLPQGELPGRVHGRAADLGRRRQGQDGHLPGRVPQARHQGAAARRQRVRLVLHPRRHRHPLRAWRHQERRHQRDRVDRGDAPEQGQLHLVRGLPRQGRDHRVQQARGRVFDQGGRLRLTRSLPQVAVPDPGSGRRRGDRRRSARRRSASSTSSVRPSQTATPIRAAASAWTSSSARRSGRANSC